MKKFLILASLLALSVRLRRKPALKKPRRARSVGQRWRSSIARRRSEAGRFLATEAG